MTKWRAQIRHLAPASTALFVFSLTLPRAGLVYHEHAGGEHFHVHAEDGARDGAHDHRHHHHHHAQHAHTPPAAHQVELETTEPPDLGHWHTQSPFHRAISPVTPALIRVPIVDRGHPTVDLGMGEIHPHRSRARGPPSPPIQFR